MSTTHTPGPWHVCPDYSKENVYRLWNEHDNYHDDTSPEAMDANARLFAMAPALFDFAELVCAGNTEIDRLEELAAALVYQVRYEGGQP